MVQISPDLERLAREDSVVAPLAALQAIALEAAAEPGWDTGVPALGQNSLADGTPLLHGLTLTVDRDRQRALLIRLADALARHRGADLHTLTVLLRSESFGPLTLLAASLTQDTATVERLADEVEIESAVLAVVAHTSTLPLLLACGRRAEPLVRSAAWSEGVCPVCAAWPTLAEIRGLARDLVLRCGRCATAWKGEQGACTFCGNQDHQTLGYLAADQERESRRAVVCDACHGYLKTMATLGALAPADLLVRDLQSLELDMAALDGGYERPDGLGFDLAVTIESAPSEPDDRSTASASGDRRGWRRWLG